VSPEEEMNGSVFTIFFEDPFWVGYLERTLDGKQFCGRIVFGKEPSNAELIEFLLYRFHEISLYPSTGESVHSVPHQATYKRSIRESKKTMKARGGLTKAREVVQEQYRERKIKRHKEKTRKTDEEKKEHRRILVEKIKNKKRGH
jgi:hypothetical protein